MKKKKCFSLNTKATTSMVNSLQAKTKELFRDVFDFGLVRFLKFET